MSIARRLSLVEVVREDIQSNTITSDQLRKNINDAIQRNNVHRVFDHVPRLADDDTLNKIAQRYLCIVSHAQFSSADGEQPDAETCRQLKTLSHEIIANGIDDLLDSDGSIRADVRQLFGLDGNKDKINIAQLICSYFGTLFQQVSTKYAADIIRIPDARGARMFNHLNKNYADLVSHDLKQRGFVVDMTGLVIKGIVLTGAAVLFGGVGFAAASILLFSAGSHSSQPGSDSSFDSKIRHGGR